VTNEIPPERRCPICGDLNLNPHADSLCPEHYLGDAPEITPVDKPHADIPNHPSRVEEARAIAGDEVDALASGSITTHEHELLDQFESGRLPSRDGEVGSESDEQTDESFLAAAMGDSGAAKAYRRDDVDVDRQQQQPTSRSTGGVGMPTGTLPLGQLDAIAPEERRRAARTRGLDWPTTEQARDQLQETINEDHRVVDAPTSLGKTHTVASTRWGARDDLTGNRPVVHLLETRDARDEAVEIAEEHGSEYTVLQSRHEACPVAAGDYDPPSDRDAADELDYEPITIEGEPASRSRSRANQPRSGSIRCATAGASRSRPHTATSRITTARVESSPAVQATLTPTRRRRTSSTSPRSAQRSHSGIAIARVTTPW
jgi:hypothetical protein